MMKITILNSQFASSINYMENFKHENKSISKVHKDNFYLICELTNGHCQKCGPRISIFAKTICINCHVYFSNFYTFTVCFLICF